MIPRNELPDDAADWRNIDVEFPTLEPNTAESCPNYPDEVMSYVNMESGDVGQANIERLAFVRTALVGRAKYWLWIYTEEDGATDCVVYSKGGPAILSLAAPSGLSAEQYLLAEYYSEVYWA